MPDYAEQWFEERAAEEAAAAEAEYAVWAATPEGRETLRKQELAALKKGQAAVEQERAWARDYPDEWAAWLGIQPYWFSFFEFGGYGFEEFLPEVGRAKAGVRLARKDERLPFQPGNIVWSDSSGGGLERDLVERLVGTLGRVEDSLGRPQTEPAQAAPSELADPDRMLTKAEVAKQFSVTPRTIDRWRAAKKLKEFVVGGVVRFRPEDVATLKKRGMKSDR